MSTIALDTTPSDAVGPTPAKKKSILQYELTKKKVKPTELMHFSRQLGAFVRAGIPILDAIEVIAEDTNKVMKEALTTMSDDIAAGKSFSDSAQKHPHVFPNFYVRTLRSAELTGKLDSVLDQLSTYIERDEEARRTIRSAMIYPGIIFAMSIITTVILMVFVLPRFETFFAEFNAQLPLPTRILLGVGQIFGAFWLPALAVIAFVTASGFLSLKTRDGRRLRDRILLGLPVVGDLIRFAIIERFCRILSSLLDAAVTIPEAMEVAIQGTNNIVFEEGLTKARTSMIEGRGLARPIAETRLFPNTVTQMMRVGEDTGTLDAQLHTAARYFETELGFKIKRFTALIEPTVITVMGLVVGFVAISLVSAMYGIYHQVGT